MSKPMFAPPSAKALNMVKGAYDLHVHSGPDALPRIANDLQIANAMRSVGMAGYVIKNHFFPTGARAHLVNQVVGGFRAIGSICLNMTVGGLNPVAVEMAAREGAKVVWLPTVDAVNERGAVQALEKKPYWRSLLEDLEKQGIQTKYVPRVDRRSEYLEAVLRMVAKWGLILATGHLSRDEIFEVVDFAKEIGVKTIVVTHPDFPSQNLPAEDQAELARVEGVYLERCFTTAYTGKIAWEEMVDRIKYSGPDKSLLTSDLGQPNNPPPEWGLPLMVDRLLAEGVSEDEIDVMLRNSIMLVESVLGGGTEG